MTQSDNRPEAAELSAREKVLLEHRLGVRRLLIDRLLIGLLLALAAFWASVAIEQFRANASDSRYFLEKRLEAGSMVRARFTALTSAAFQQTVAACSLQRNHPPPDQFKSAVVDLIQQLNSSALLFSKEYLEDSHLVVNLFSGAASELSFISCDSRYFFDEVSNYFTERTKNEVHGSTNSWKGFQPVKVDQETLDRTGSSEYFKINLVAWRENRTRSSKAANRPLESFADCVNRLAR